MAKMYPMNYLVWERTDRDHTPRVTEAPDPITAIENWVEVEKASIGAISWCGRVCISQGDTPGCVQFAFVHADGNVETMNTPPFAFADQLWQMRAELEDLKRIEKTLHILDERMKRMIERIS